MVGLLCRESYLSVLSVCRLKYFTDILQPGRTRRANTINEEQLQETELIQSSFLFNNRIIIIISVCLFHDRMGHRDTCVGPYFCVALRTNVDIPSVTLFHTIFENISTTSIDFDSRALAQFPFLSTPASSIAWRIALCVRKL